MQTVVAKFFKSGEPVVNMFSGTFVTAKSCLELSWDHRFVPDEVDAE